jgi:acyl-CoA thioesterase FadM
MSLFFRSLRVLLVSLLSSTKLAPLDTSSVPFIVWPNDLDLNGHMNNGRYLTVMDLGRFDLIARTGLAKTVLRERWQPLIGAATIRFRRSLQPFARYTLQTRVVGWDEKWLFIEQRFEQKGELVAQAYVKGLFRRKHENVPISALLSAMGQTSLTSPELPESVRHWIQAEALPRTAA